MRALVQRVTEASVTVNGEFVGSIEAGLCVFVGITHSDDEAKAKRMANKIWGLRCFDDDAGTMNLSASDLGNEILVISQFTLYGDTSKGRRPSYVEAARPEHAEPLIECLVGELRLLGATVATGRFRTQMKVALINDGPITLSLEV